MAGKKDASTILAACPRGTTSHLHNHLRSHHPERYATLTNSLNPPTSLALRSWTNGHNLAFDRNALWKLLARAIIPGDHSFNLVEEPFFEKAFEFSHKGGCFVVVENA